MRRLRVDLPELIFALEFNDAAGQHYLNTETGEVSMVMSDGIALAEDFLQEHPESADDFARFVEWADENPRGDVIKEEYEVAFRVAIDSQNRYLYIDPMDSRDGYRIVEDFVHTVKDAHLQNKLFGAIEGRGAFRRFKDTLLDYPETRERWFKYKEERFKEEALSWLESVGIELGTE